MRLVSIRSPALRRSPSITSWLFRDDAGRTGATPLENSDGPKVHAIRRRTGARRTSIRRELRSDRLNGRTQRLSLRYAMVVMTA